DESALIVEMLDENYHTASIEGFSIVNKDGMYFIPTEVALNDQTFKQWIEDEAKKKVVFDAKAVYVALLNQGMTLKGVVFDLLLGAYLANPGERHESISVIASRYGNYHLESDDVVYGKGAKKQVPEEDILATHLVNKAHAIFTVKDALMEQLDEADLVELHDELELPLAYILGDMEHIGVQIDTEQLKMMGAELKERLETIESEAYEMAGESFNLNSPKQLGVVLFENLGLPVIKKTKTGYSTAVDVLEKLYDKHEIIPKIMLYRQLGKLYSTYIEGLQKVTHQETNKIHTRFNQALTQTGRLSSVDPNLQNIPIRLPEGRKVRKAFVPSQKGWKIFAADYSQIELRVLAHIAQDEKLIRAFQEDLDIHRQTASEVFHVAHDDVTSLMRDQAKAVNFG